MVFIGAIPYMVSEQMGLMSYEIGLAGALFESMSGLTTTGATVFDPSIKDGTTADGYYNAPKSLLLWRSQSQWLGGMGIIVLATIIFSRLFGGGIQVLQAEMPGTGLTRLKPQMAQTARLLWSLYLALTIAEIVLLRFLGDIPLYDSICNSFSTVSTGGFSPKVESIGSYDSSAADSIVTFFMLISGVNFVLLYYVSTTLLNSENPISLRIKKSFNLFRGNDELKFYFFLILTSFLA